MLFRVNYVTVTYTTLDTKPIVMAQNPLTLGIMHIAWLQLCGIDNFQWTGCVAPYG